MLTGELKRLFDLIGVSLSREALDAVCEIGDTDRDGKIQRGEFVQMLRLKDNEKHLEKHLLSLSDADIRCMFGIFDQNHDGKIVAEELVNVFGLLGRKMTQQQAELFIKQATSGKDDALSFTAFSKLMKADSSLFEK
jgi:Ca2+-binding EF-hand superfamily protein